MEKENQYYFSHDVNARYDSKIIAMRSIYGFEGYGWYWAIIEIMRANSNFRLPFSKFQLLALAKELDTNVEMINKYLNDCNEIGLFIVIEDVGIKYLTSQSLQKRMLKYIEKKQILIDRAKKGAKTRWENNQDPMLKQCLSNAKAMLTDANKIKENKIKENKIKENKIKYNIRDFVFHFEKVWSLYPNKDGKKAAKRHYLSSVKTKKDMERIEEALKRYLNSKKVKNGYIKNGSTWFNNWEDWEFFTETYTEEEKRRMQDEEINKRIFKNYA